MPNRISTQKILLFFAAVLVIASLPARAKAVSIIRDVEIENTLRAMATPIFKAAGLTPSSIHIRVVHDDTVNAFVSGGQNLYINTGLLLLADNANQVIGVIAHETGHIAGGHLARIGKSYENSAVVSLMSAVLGLGAGIATGRGDVGAVVAQGGQQMATRAFLAHTRTEEGSADQAAFKYLNETHQSAEGFLHFLQKLEGSELLIHSDQYAYTQTHPLTPDRIDAVKADIAHSKWTDAKTDPKLEERFQRIKAKIYGYLNPPAQTLRAYPPSDNSIAGRYARAFAYLEKPDEKKALALADSLLKDEPNDPFFHELRGQILYESGQGVNAIGDYRRAVDLLPNEPLLRFELAQVLVETGDNSKLDEAIKNLKIAVDREPRFASAWHYLGIAYGRLDKMGESSLALGEEALLLGRSQDAEYHAKKAEKAFPRGSREWLHAQDILTAINPGKDQGQK